MAGPTEADIQRFGQRLREYLQEYDYPDEGEILFEFRDGKWFVRMRLGDEWTGEDIDFVV